MTVEPRHDIGVKEPVLVGYAKYCLSDPQWFPFALRNRQILQLYKLHPSETVYHETILKLLCLPNIIIDRAPLTIRLRMLDDSIVILSRCCIEI